MRTLLLAVALLSAACSSPPPGGQPPPMCSGEVPVCPEGAFTCCSQGEMAFDMIVPCCQNGEIIRAHARAAGWLVHNDNPDCAAISCNSGECAVNGDGVAKCCDFTATGSAGACDQP